MQQGYMHNRNRIPQTRKEAERQYLSQNGLFQSPFPSPISPSEVPQVSLKRHRLNGFALLWEVCTSHWMNRVSFITRGSSTTAKRNKSEKNKRQYTDSPHLYPRPPTSSEADMLDQFVIQQPHQSKALSALDLSYSNPVFGLLKVHAAAHPSVCLSPKVWLSQHILLFSVSHFCSLTQSSDNDIINAHFNFE